MPKSLSPLSVPTSTGHRLHARERKRIAFKYGMIFGVILAVFSSIIFHVNLPISLLLFSLPHYLHLSFRITTITLIYWGIYFLAGLLSTLRTQRVETACIVCLWASLCYLLSYILNAAITAFPLSGRILADAAYFSYFSLVTLHITDILVQHIGLGIVVGTLGGLLSTKLARKQISQMPPPNGDFTEKDSDMNMDMMDLPAEAQQFIVQKELGTPLEIYKPPTVSTIISGIVVLLCGIFVGWIGNVSIGSSSYRGAGYLSMFFVLLVIFLLGLGLWTIFNAFVKRNNRVVVCTQGVASLQSSEVDSFRWLDVLTTIRSTTGSAKHLRHIFTVHCHDNRKFVFKDLSHLHDLAERIDVEIARAKSKAL